MGFQGFKRLQQTPTQKDGPPAGTSLERGRATHLPAKCFSRGRGRLPELRPRAEQSVQTNLTDGRFAHISQRHPKCFPDSSAKGTHCQVNDQAKREARRFRVSGHSPPNGKGSGPSLRWTVRQATPPRRLYPQVPGTRCP